MLHVVGTMDRGGAETLLMNLYREVDREQIQFDFLVHEGAPGDYDDEIRQLGGRLYRIPRLVAVNALSYRRAVREHLLKHPEHRVVHGHIGSSAAVYLREARRAGRYTIAHSHAKKFPLSPTELAFRTMSYPTRFIAHRLMAPTRRAGTDRYGRRFLNPGRGEVVANGIRTSRFACDEEAHQASKQALGLAGKPVIGHVGRFAVEKNHAFLLETFARTKALVSDAQLLCAGRGPLLAKVRSQALDLGVADSVHFLGVRDDVADVLRACDIFVFPSTAEGLGIAAVEAQASGLPTLLSTGVEADAVVTDLADRMDLAEGPQAWATWCANHLRALAPRRDRTSQVADAGYDIGATARRLSELYLQRSKGA